MRKPFTVRFSPCNQIQKKRRRLPGAACGEGGNGQWDQFTDFTLLKIFSSVAMLLSLSFLEIQ